MASSSLVRGPREAAADHVAPQAAVWLKLVCEPKLHALTWQAIDTDPATDDKQQPMKLTKSPQDPYSVWKEIGTISYQFDTAANPGNSIPQFKGTTRVTLATDSAHLESKQLLQGVSTVWHAGDLRFDIAAVQKDDKGGWAVKTRVTVEPGAGKLQRDASLLNAVLYGVRCQLLDEHDRPLAFSGGFMSAAQELPRSVRAYDLEWNFASKQEIPDVGPLPTAPVKLVWDFPADIVSVDVPFTLHNLKLRD